MLCEIQISTFITWMSVKKVLLAHGHPHSFLYHPLISALALEFPRYPVDHKAYSAYFRTGVWITGPDSRVET